MKKIIGIVVLVVVAFFSETIFAEVNSLTNFSSPEFIRVGSWPEAVVVGDLNRDGRNDVVVSTSFYFDEENDYCLFVFFQGNDGKLGGPLRIKTSGDYSHRPRSIGLVDINGDGRNDIAVGLSGLGIEIFIQKASGGFYPGVFYKTQNSHKVQIVDFNKDGHNDIIGIGFGTGEINVIYGSAKQENLIISTINISAKWNDDVQVANVGANGLADIIISRQSEWNDSGVDVFFQERSGKFSTPVRFAIEEQWFSGGIIFGDAHGYDKKDAVVISDGFHCPVVYVFPMGSQGLMAEYRANGWPNVIKYIDVNNDGRKDVAVLVGNQVSLYEQQRDGTMHETIIPVPYTQNSDSQCMDIGDINGDGKKDIVVVDHNYGLAVVRQQ